jgi:hypothetical protein
MNDVSCPFIESFVTTYIDDILILNNSWKENISHVTWVLETLKRNQLIEKLKKPEFRKEYLIHIGHIRG